jgi:hypothetical protein
MHSRTLRWCVACTLAAGCCGVAYAGGGGRGGDSSMNPFTGDSYAYFNGGHNLGEKAMIRPGGTPPATGYQLYPPNGRVAAQSKPQAPATPDTTENRGQGRFSKPGSE